MPHEELREKNIRLVIENALDSFLENGIEKTKVADVARRSGLTERSVFRYFETKADLVLAASLLYWNRILALIDRMSHENSDGGTTGLEDAANVLVCYSMLYHLDPKGMRFTLDAELTLQAAGRLHERIMEEDMAEQNNNQQDINQLLKVRYEKLQELQANGKDPFVITKYDVTNHTIDIKEKFDEMEGKEVSIAGRMMFKRVMGKASFCNIQDLKGRIQVYVARDNIGEESYKDFKKSLKAAKKA